MLALAVSRIANPTPATAYERRSAALTFSMRRNLQRTTNAHSTTHHHADSPNTKSRMSESHAPKRPPELRICSTDELCDQPGSALSKVNRISARYSASTTIASHHDSRRSAAIWGGSGLSADRTAPDLSPIRIFN